MIGVAPTSTAHIQLTAVWTVPDLVDTQSGWGVTDGEIATARRELDEEVSQGVARVTLGYAIACPVWITVGRGSARGVTLRDRTVAAREDGSWLAA